MISPARPIFTIGHGTRDWDTFVALLERHGITALADIRAYPSSRHCPQFDQDAMTAALPLAGIAYHHIPALGGRRRGRPDSPNTAWRHPSFRAYADHMETTEFAAGLATLTALAGRQRVAYLCAETVYWKCHRSLVSDALLADGWRVWHIMDDGVRPHRYTPAAHLVDGRLTYRGIVAQLPLAVV